MRWLLLALAAVLAASAQAQGQVQTPTPGPAPGPPRIVGGAGAGCIAGAVELPPTGPVIGAATGRNYKAQSVLFAPNDVLLLYTDGLSEAGRNRHDFLETRGLARILAEAARDTDAERIKDRIVAAVEAHAGGLPHDDMCALIARVKGKA